MGPILLTRINFNPGVDKSLQSAAWNYLLIAKLQRYSR